MYYVLCVVNYVHVYTLHTNIIYAAARVGSRSMGEQLAVITK